MGTWGNPSGSDAQGRPDETGPTPQRPGSSTPPGQSGYPAQGPVGGPPGYGPGYPQQGYPQQGYVPPMAEPKPGVMKLRPQGVGDILDAAFQTLKGNPGASFGLSLMAGLVAVALMAIIVAASGGAAIDRGDGTGFGVLAVIVAIAAVPIILVVDLISTGGLIHVFSQAVLGHRASIGESMRVGTRRLWAMLGMAVLGLLMYVGLIVVLVLFGLILHAAQVPGWAIALLIVVIALVALFFTIRFAFWLHIVVMESAGPITALRRSVRLTKRRMWRTFGIMALALILTSIVSSVVQTIGNVLAMAIFGLSGSYDSSNGSSHTSVGAAVGAVLLLGILSMLVSAITQPFILNVLGGLYLDARFRDEGLAGALMASAPLPQDQPGLPQGPGASAYGS